ncbi:hypothetical protein AC622_11170 [Bacillus sp. FJAT-27916]|uniref:hypothetical protein n=1 Tax=Bacillus sp. FJAT-27916 TaxID=1679169 RepID=UPI0006716667|nr:hypothetical protein [Bacillus sp. FJAT-27916]KMY44719.1 hypothetical protein AC622_11170 [Bacillus sp. FJAT-27916]
MDLLFWLALGFIILGLCALVVIKLILKDPTERNLLWLIGGTTVWGAVSILLVPWLVGRL